MIVREAFLVLSRVEFLKAFLAQGYGQAQSPKISRSIRKCQAANGIKDSARSARSIPSAGYSAVNMNNANIKTVMADVEFPDPT